MNYRISKKIYKRADSKLKSFIAINHDKRMILQKKKISFLAQKKVFLFLNRING